jgi:hypothetical protein
LKVCIELPSSSTISAGKVASLQGTTETSFAQPSVTVMIEPSFIHPSTIVLGGVPMIDQPASAKHHVVPVQVWTRLTTDRQTRAIRLMAQLAFNLVLAQCDWAVKELDHAKPTDHTQDPA